MIVTKTQTHPEMGAYKPTSLDQAKQEADFRLIQVSPYYIRWKDGRGEKVNFRQLKKLQKEHPNWMPDF
jgi:hypothetical protein